jgi:membrane protein DedA with SNARE-associated domain
VCYYGAKVLETEGGHCPVSSLITSLTDFIQNLYVATGLIGIVLAMAIESCCIPLPSEIIMPLAGSMLAVSSEAGAKHLLGISPSSPLWLNLILIALAGSLGSLAGSLLAYGIGYAGGRPLMLKYGKYVLISQHDADKADKFFQRWGVATAFFSRMLPVVRTYISLPAGITKMSPIKFSIYTFLGSLPWCLLLAYLGYQLGTHYEQISGPLHYLDGLIVVLVVVLVVLYVWRHIRNDRRARAEHAAAENTQQQANNSWGQPPFQAGQQSMSNQSPFQGQPPMNQPPFQTQQPMNQSPFQGQQVPPSSPQQSWGQPQPTQQQWGQQVPPSSPQQSWGQPQPTQQQWGQQVPPSSPQQPWGQPQPAPQPQPTPQQWGRPAAPSQPQQGNNPGSGNGWQR